MLDPGAQLSFTVHAKGPGPVHTVPDASDPCKLIMLATTAGTYSLELMSQVTQELLGSNPLQVGVVGRLETACTVRHHRHPWTACY